MASFRSSGLMGLLFVLVLFQPFSQESASQQSVSRQGEDLSALVERAQRLAEQEEYAEALRLYNRAIEQRPESAELHYNRGVMAYDAGRLSEAAEDFTRAIESSDGNARAFFNRGNVRYLQERYEQAISDYSSALEIDESLTEARLNRGIARYRRGAFADAVADFTAVLDEGASVEARYYRGTALLRQEEYGRAIEDFRAVLESRPEHSDAMYNLGLAYIRRAEQLSGGTAAGSGAGENSGN